MIKVLPECVLFKLTENFLASLLKQGTSPLAFKEAVADGLKDTLGIVQMQQLLNQREVQGFTMSNPVEKQ